MSKTYLIQGKKVIRGPEVKSEYQGVAPINVDNTTNLISIDLTDINAELAKKAIRVGSNTFDGVNTFENVIICKINNAILLQGQEPVIDFRNSKGTITGLALPRNPTHATSKEYVDAELKLKVDETIYEEDQQELATELDKKAEKEYVNTELDKKANLASANTFTGFRNTFEQVGINVSANFVAAGQSKAILQLNRNDLEMDIKDGDLSLKGKKLKDVATPVLDTDAANKKYADDGLALKANATDLPTKENVLKLFLRPNQTTNGVLTTQQIFTLPQNVNTLKELWFVVKSSSPASGIATIPIIIDKVVYGQNIASWNFLTGYFGTKQVRVVLPSGAGINGVIWVYTDLAIRAILGVEGTPLGA